MSEPLIRKVQPDELEEVWRVHVASSHDGMVRRGGPATPPADRPVAAATSEEEVMKAVVYAHATAGRGVKTIITPGAA